MSFVLNVSFNWLISKFVQTAHTSEQVSYVNLKNPTGLGVESMGNQSMCLICYTYKCNVADCFDHSFRVI